VRCPLARTERIKSNKMNESRASSARAPRPTVPIALASSAFAPELTVRGPRAVASNARPTRASVVFTARARSNARETIARARLRPREVDIAPRVVASRARVPTSAIWLTSLSTRHFAPRADARECPPPTPARRRARHRPTSSSTRARSRRRSRGWRTNRRSDTRTWWRTPSRARKISSRRRARRARAPRDRARGRRRTRCSRERRSTASRAPTFARVDDDASERSPRWIDWRDECMGCERHLSERPLLCTITIDHVEFSEPRKFLACTRVTPHIQYSKTHAPMYIQNLTHPHDRTVGTPTPSRARPPTPPF